MSMNIRKTHVSVALKVIFPSLASLAFIYFARSSDAEKSLMEGYVKKGLITLRMRSGSKTSSHTHTAVSGGESEKERRQTIPGGPLSV